MVDEPQDLRRISPDDVNAVTERLKEWMPTLSEQEQLVLGWVLTRAAAAEDADVEAYTQRTEGGVPMSSLMADAAGLQEVSGFRVVDIGPRVWAFRFE